MLNDPHSHGLWEVTAPPPPPSEVLAGEITVDVALVGAGYTGLSAALHLAEAGTSVALLEAREVGFGGAGRNVGLINAGMWVPPDDMLRELGPRYGERCLDLLGNGPLLVRELIARHAIACELETSGTLHCAVGAGGLRDIEARCRQWQAHGAPVEVLSAAETEKRVGTRAYAGALLDRRAGTLQPLAYARGLGQAAVHAGAGIFTRSAVTGVSRAGSKWRVQTAGGSVLAEWVLVTSNFYSEGPWQAIREEQIYLPYFNLATAPLSAAQRAEILPGREGCWDTKTVLCSYRYDAAGRMVFGSVGALDSIGLPVHSAWGRRALRKLFPQLATVTFEHEWYGRIGMTPNVMPRFHRFEHNIVGFCCYNGRGISPGTAFGKVLAEHVLGRIDDSAMPLPATPLAPPSFRAAREAFYHAGSVLAHAAGARL